MWFLFERECEYSLGVLLVAFHADVCILRQRRGCEFTRVDAAKPFLIPVQRWNVTQSECSSSAGLSQKVFKTIRAAFSILCYLAIRSGRMRKGKKEDGGLCWGVCNK